MGYIEELREMIGTRPIILNGSAIIVLNHSQEVLLQLRTDTNDWSVPGGAMEIGETLEETASRELLEETGLKSEMLQFLGVLSGKDMYYQYPNGNEVYNVIHVFQADSVAGSLQVDGEGQELQYFPIEKLPEELNPVTERILHKYLFAIAE
ncbi:NUDIX hydrolase [Ectobacillus funiculus]|jgi:8-oxo-dGTP pyrophosphatase MutT (NUDIX family)|uniref:NUDIX hydrolase n=1 Tax=Ectobacillus funiculus TaxID=137993 RepID=UPI00101B7868|nr:NUDIX hydrolase [Ectobacillus funiculus]